MFEYRCLDVYHPATMEPMINALAAEGFQFVSAYGHDHNYLLFERYTPTPAEVAQQLAGIQSRVQSQSLSRTTSS